MSFAFLSNARVPELDMHARAAEDNLYHSSVQALYMHAQLFQHNINKTMEFFLNVSLNSATKIFNITVKGLELAISCVRDQHATTAPVRHMLETGSLNWLQFMLQWFTRFPEFAEFTERSAHLGKTPIITNTKNENENLSSIFH